MWIFFSKMLAGIWCRIACCPLKYHFLRYIFGISAMFWEKQKMIEEEIKEWDWEMTLSENSNAGKKHCCGNESWNETEMHWSRISCNTGPKIQPCTSRCHLKSFQKALGKGDWANQTWCLDCTRVAIACTTSSVKMALH